MSNRRAAAPLPSRGGAGGGVSNSSHHHSLRRGFALTGVLLLAGVLAQVTVGPVDWQWMAAPVGLVVAVAFVVVTLAVYALRRRLPFCHFMGTAQVAVPVMGAVVVLTMVMGLTRQDDAADDGSWPHHMLTFWPFVLAYTGAALVLAQVTVRGICHLRRWRDVPVLLAHGGLLLALVAATLGHADMRRLRMVAGTGYTEWTAYDVQGREVQLPLGVELQRFILESYDDGTPRRFASELLIYSHVSNHKYAATIDVNRPVEIDGWKLYQQGYDTQRGAQSQYSVIELVRDPWLPAVYTGIYMLLAGAALLLLQGGRRRDSR